MYDFEEILLDEKSNTIIKLNIENGVDYDRDYKLIVLQNFQQEAFSVDDTMYEDSYSFTINARATEDINLSIQVLNETKEISIIFVKNPEEYVTTFDLEKLGYFEEVYTKRFIVSDKPKPNINYLSRDYTYKSGVDHEPIFLSNEKYERRVLPSSDSGVDAFLHLGSVLEFDPTVYAIIGLKDWEQIDIKNEEVIYLEASPNETTGIEIQIPELEHEIENLQYIAFPAPYRYIMKNIKVVRISLSEQLL